MEGGARISSHSHNSALHFLTRRINSQGTHLLSLCPDGPSPSVFVGPASPPYGHVSGVVSLGPHGQASWEPWHPPTLTTGRIVTLLAHWLGSANPRCHCNQPADHEDGTAIPLSRLDRPSESKERCLVHKRRRLPQSGNRTTSIGNSSFSHSHCQSLFTMAVKGLLVAAAMAATAVAAPLVEERQNCASQW